MSQTVSTCSFYLRHINQINRFLSKLTKERVVNAVNTSRLDYCKALLYGTSVGNISYPQRMHNSAARLILRRPRSDSARPLIKNFTGWPWHTESISKYGYLLTVMHDEAPVYLCEFVRPYQPVRAMRSAHSQWLRPCGTLYLTLLKPVTLSPASNVD